MKIAIISTMEGSSWGGSEELWHRTALAALRDNHQILINTSNYCEKNKLLPLQSNGAVISKRNNFIPNILIKLLRKSEYIYKKYLFFFEFNIIIAFKPGIIIISQGRTFEAAIDIKYSYLINKLSIPYYLISQHNFEYGPISTFNSIALRFIQNAKIFFFVSYRNHIIAEYQTLSYITNFQKIDNPINLKSIGIKKYNVSSSTLRMACVARIDCSFKGQDLLVHALNNPKWNARDYQLHFFGTGPDETYLKKLISFYNLDDKIHIAGEVSDIDSIWETNHILLLPSISEGTPLVLLEAMLSGRPALATDVGDISRYVIDQETGFLVEAPTIKLLQLKLEQLWLKRDNLKEMGVKAYNNSIKITDLHPETTLLKKIFCSLTV